LKKQKKNIGDNSHVALKLFEKDARLLKRLSILEYRDARKLVLSEIGEDIGRKNWMASKEDL